MIIEFPETDLKTKFREYLEILFYDDQKKAKESLFG